MFLTDEATDLIQMLKDLLKHPPEISFYSKVALPALAALVPAAIGAFFKWTEDHSRSRQRVALTDRMAGLAKMIGEVPDVAVDLTSGIPGRISGGYQAESQVAARVMGRTRPRALARC